MIDELFIKKVNRIVLETASFIKKESVAFDTSRVSEKGLNQLVSYVDQTAERMLVEGLKHCMPQAGFIAEEGTEATISQEWMWVIDPLDGTTNFIHGIPVYSISVGLLHQGIPVCGVVYEINRDELFYAYASGGAYLNGTRIRVKQNPYLSKSLLATGFPYYDFEGMQAYLNTLHELMKQTQGMRRMGSAAVDLAYVAAGRFDGFFEYGLQPWDVCGGICLVTEAGGHLSTFSGSSDYIFGKEIIAASDVLHESLLAIVSKHFYSS